MRAGAVSLMVAIGAVTAVGSTPVECLFKRASLRLYGVQALFLVLSFPAAWTLLVLFVRPVFRIGLR